MTWARVLVEVSVVTWWVRLLVILAGRPASRWRTRWVGKAISILLAVVLFSTWFGFVIPYGAAVVWWRVLVRTRDPFELPMADGRPMP